MPRRQVSASWLLTVTLSVSAAGCPDAPTAPTPPVPPTPPVLGLTCPSAQSGISSQNQPVAISWLAPTAEGGTLPVQLSCAPASGSLFQPGVTSVACTATDAANQRANCTFNVTIANGPTLALTCPAAQSGISFQNQPVSITWPDPAPQGGTAPVQTSCAPASGSLFQPGVTPVSCTASDTAGERAACAFTVTITRPPQLSAVRFTAYGDSITWGKDSPPGAFLVFPDPPPWFAYPAQLRSLLEMRYQDQTPSMANEGWPGEAVGDGLTRLPGALMANNPEVLLLLDGANDLLGNPSSPTTVYIASQLREMVRAAKRQSSTIKVLLATFPPQTRGTFPYDRGAGRAFVPELNQRIAAVAQSEGVTLVDLYAAFPSNLKPYIGQDGLHPTQKGYTLIARTFANVIQQTLEVQTTSAGASLR